MDKGGFDTVEDAYIKITGGELTLNIAGDGLDSNGDLLISGGKTIIYGPTNSGNGSLDYNGDSTISGGICIALGTSLATVTAETNYSSILISTPDIKEGETYTIEYGSNSQTITMSSLIY